MSTPVSLETVPEARVSRDGQIAETILFLDGLTGTGKTMLGPILATFKRVEVQRFDSIHEHISALKFLNRIEQDAATSMIRMYADKACYNAMIGRETNFRWKDLSGVLSNPGGTRYLRRLFQPDGNSVLDRINHVRPILQLVSHQAMGIASTMFEALQDRIRVIELVRHPLYLLEHWYSYIDRFGTDPRDFTIWIDHYGTHMPWFAYGWEEKYQTSSKMDRVIFSIDCLTRLADITIQELDERSRDRVMVIPFEGFVLDPFPYLNQIEHLLDTTTTGSTRRALKKQKVPRKLTTAGRDMPIYRRYNWRPPPNASTETAELQKRREYAEREASAEGLKVLKKICEAYETKYPIAEAFR